MFIFFYLFTFLLSSQNGYYSSNVYYPSNEELQVYLTEGIEIVDYSNKSVPISQEYFQPSVNDQVNESIKPVSMAQYNTNEYSQSTYYEYPMYQTFTPQCCDVNTQQTFNLQEQMFIPESIPTHYHENVNIQNPLFSTKEMPAAFTENGQDLSEQVFGTATMPDFAQSDEYYSAVIVPKYLVDKVPMISEKLQMPVFVISEPPTENIQPLSFTPEPSSFPTTQFLPNFENPDNLKTNDTKESNPEINNYSKTPSSFTSRVTPSQDYFSTQQVTINSEPSVQNQQQLPPQSDSKFSPQSSMNQQSSQSPQSPQSPQSSQSPQSPQSPQSSQSPQSPQSPQSSQSPQSPQSPQSSQSPQSPQSLVNPQQMPQFKDNSKDSKDSVDANDPKKSAIKSSDGKKKDNKSNDMDNGVGDLLISLIFVVLLV